MVWISRVFTGLVMSVCIGLAWGKMNGAPAEACLPMKPQGHIDAGFSKQTDAPPYDINVTPSFYCGPNTPVTVELIGAPYGEQFKGFLCEPRTGLSSSVTVGTFSTPAGTQNNCGNTAAITHTNNIEKKSVEFTWTPGSTKENVYIVCTIVRNFTTFWIQESTYVEYAGDSRCIDPGVLPTSCTNDQDCDDAVMMARCEGGTCKCPNDMTIAHPTDTYCSNKKLGDECSQTEDCQTIPDTVCENTCKCQSGFKYNTTSGPCYPKVLHDACGSDNECRFANHSVCIDQSCQCPRVGFIEIGNATHKNCSKTSLPTTCSADQDCNSVVSRSVCKTDGQLRYCECPSNLVLRNSTDKECSEKSTDAATTVVLSVMMLIGCLIASVV